MVKRFLRIVIVYLLVVLLMLYLD